MWEITKASLRYNALTLALMYLGPLVVIGPFAFLADKPERVLWLLAYFLLFFVALGWIWTVSAEEREKRLVLLATLPVSKRQIALARQLAIGLPQLLGALLAGGTLLLTSRFQGLPAAAGLTTLATAFGLILVSTQITLLSEEVKHLASGSRAMSVAAGLVSLPFYFVTFIYLALVIDDDPLGGNFGGMAQAVHDSPWIIALFYLSAALLGWLAVARFTRRESFETGSALGLGMGCDLSGRNGQ